MTVRKLNIGCSSEVTSPAVARLRQTLKKQLAGPLSISKCFLSQAVSGSLRNLRSVALYAPSTSFCCNLGLEKVRICRNCTARQ